MSIADLSPAQQTVTDGTLIEAFADPQTSPQQFDCGCVTAMHVIDHHGERPYEMHLVHHCGSETCALHRTVGYWVGGTAHCDLCTDPEQYHLHFPIPFQYAAANRLRCRDCCVGLAHADD